MKLSEAIAFYEKNETENTMVTVHHVVKMLKELEVPDCTTCVKNAEGRVQWHDDDGYHDIRFISEEEIKELKEKWLKIARERK